MVAISELVLLITGPDGVHQVLVGSDECAYRKVFGSFVEAWGEDNCWYDDEAKELASEGGVSIGRWRARRLGRADKLAVVVLASDRPVGIYLVDDAGMADRTVHALERDGVSFDVVRTEPLPEADPEKDSHPLTAVVRTKRGSARPTPPRPALSVEFCPRCEDHPLHEDALFDVVGPNGDRVCVACARLLMLRESGPNERR